MYGLEGLQIFATELNRLIEIHANCNKIQEEQANIRQVFALCRNYKHIVNETNLIHILFKKCDEFNKHYPGFGNEMREYLQKYVCYKS